jgi:hypothetical protein
LVLLVLPVLQQVLLVPEALLVLQILLVPEALLVL